MKLTAGILAHKDEKYLLRCLETLTVQEGLGELGKNWQIVIRDNATPDKTYLFDAQKQFPQVMFLMNGDNAGFSRGHNDIIRRYPAEFHAVLNNDILYNPDFLQKLLKTLEENPRFGSSTGKLLYWDYGGHPEKTNIIDSCGIHMSKAHAFVDRGQGEEDTAFTPNDYDTPGVCFGGSGAAVLYRRESLEAVQENGNYYDERMFMYKEDIDLAYRLMVQGHFCLYVPEAIAWHHRTTSVPRNKRSMREKIGSAAHESLLLRKHRKQWSFSTRWCTMLRQYGKWFYLLIFEPKVFFAARKLLREIST